MRVLSLATTAFSAVATSSPPREGPCDIFGADSTPCVAAHSMVRALYGNYSGPLYSVRRVSDNGTELIKPRSPGGVVDVSTQDNFCAGTDCTVQRIFDQSPMGNHLDVAPGGGAAHNPDKPVNAASAPITVSGHTAYGARFEGGMGYRNDNTTGVAIGDDAETLYMVADGVYYNEKCCFDYGNAEIDALDHGEGTMEAIYWGNFTGWRHFMGAGPGPWVAADLENGVWSGPNTTNPGTPSLHFDFVTAMMKAKPGTWALKGGNAQEGGLSTFHEGVRPPRYEVMKKQGGIILGIGGDNSNRAVGIFYEGVMTVGYSSNAADDAVQSNIAAAGYARTALV